ncbi:MAG TPA: cupin domain-containing protein [Solirubrobacteraceae bacterium]|jgi:mannose-6-phosphate isomerase-like protein (cupin superfamily)
MPDYTAKRLDEMEASFGGAFKKVRAELGVTSFGVQVIEIPPDVTQYPEHDHADSGQEEVFGVLAGSGRIVIGGEEVALEPDVYVRVAPNEPRKIYSGPEGLKLIAIGGVPGKPYEIAEASKLTGATA